MQRELLSLFYKTVSKIKSALIFNHSLQSLPCFIHHNWTSSGSISFKLLDLSSLFVYVLGFNGANSLQGKSPLNDTDKE